MNKATRPLRNMRSTHSADLKQYLLPESPPYSHNAYLRSRVAVFVVSIAISDRVLARLESLRETDRDGNP